MSTVALSGSDTIILKGRPMTDLADNDVALLNFPNDLANVKTGKNGNSIYSFNESGKQCVLKIRVLKGSADDKFLNNLLSQMQANFAGFVLLTGEFIKKIGDGTGKVIIDTYLMSGGVFTKIPEAKSNVEGDTEQSISAYEIKFSNAPRSIS